MKAWWPARSFVIVLVVCIPGSESQNVTLKSTISTPFASTVSQGKEVTTAENTHISLTSRVSSVSVSNGNSSVSFQTYKVRNMTITSASTTQQVNTLHENTTTKTHPTQEKVKTTLTSTNATTSQTAAPVTKEIVNVTTVSRHTTTKYSMTPSATSKNSISSASSTVPQRHTTTNVTPAPTGINHTRSVTSKKNTSTQQSTTRTPTSSVPYSTGRAIITTSATDPNIRPYLAKLLQLTQYLVINGTYDPKLNNHNEFLFKNYSIVMGSYLMTHYQKFLPGRIGNISVINFRQGSVQVEYVVSIIPPTSKSTADAILNGVINASSQWDVKQPVLLLGVIEVNKTHTLSLQMINELEKKLKLPCAGIKDACSRSEECIIETSGMYTCKHKCSTIDCGSHGTCAVNTQGQPVCSCTEDSQYIYHGPRCGQRGAIHIENHTGSKTAAIAGGACGAVILILIIVIAVLVRKERNRKKRRMDNISTSNLDVENYKIENVPVNGFEHRANMRAGRENIGYQPSNIGRPIHRISNDSRERLSGDITMEQMPRFDNLDPPEPRTISDYIEKD